MFCYFMIISMFYLMFVYGTNGKSFIMYNVIYNTDVCTHFISLKHYPFTVFIRTWAYISSLEIFQKVILKIIF